MNNLPLYQLIEDIRGAIAEAMRQGTPELAIYLAIQDLTREVIRPQAEQAVQRDLNQVKTERRNNAKD